MYAGEAKATRRSEAIFRNFIGRGRKLADPDHEVDPGADRLGELFRDPKVELHTRMLQREVANRWDDVVADKKAEPAMDSVPLRVPVVSLSSASGERNLANRSAHTSDERRGPLRRPCRACGAADEDDAELRFERPTATG